MLKKGLAVAVLHRTVGKVADGFFLKNELTLIGYLGALGGPVWAVLLLGVSGVDGFPLESLWLGNG